MIVQATLVVLTEEREGEFSGEMILLRLSARTEAGEVHINSSKLREDHIGIWKNGGVFL